MKLMFITSAGNNVPTDNKVPTGNDAPIGNHVPTAMTSKPQAKIWRWWPLR